MKALINHINVALNNDVNSETIPEYIENYDYEQFITTIKENTGIEFPLESQIIENNMTFDYIPFDLENFPDDINFIENEKFDVDESEILHAGSINFISGNCANTRRKCVTPQR